MKQLLPDGSIQLKQLCKTILLFTLGMISVTAYAQKKPQGFILGVSPNLQSWNQYTANGFSTSASTTNGDYFNVSNTYNLKFGAQNTTEAGYNRFIKLFQYEGQSYSLTKAVPGAKPFQKVVINRYGDDPEQKITSLFVTAIAQSNNNNSTI